MLFLFWEKKIKLILQIMNLKKEEKKEPNSFFIILIGKCLSDTLQLRLPYLGQLWGEPMLEWELFHKLWSIKTK